MAAPMLSITEKLTVPATPQATLTLPFDLRQKSRLRVTLDDGREAGLVLERGTYCAVAICCAPMTAR